MQNASMDLECQDGGSLRKVSLVEKALRDEDVSSDDRRTPR